MKRLSTGGMPRLAHFVRLTALVSLVLGIYVVDPAHATPAAPASNGRIAWTQDLPPTAWTIRADGSDQQLLASFPNPLGLTSLVRGMSFSADGSKLAVMYEQFFGTGTLCGGVITDCWSIFLMNGDGSDAHVVYSSEHIGSGGLALSPDGGTVAFTKVVDSGTRLKEPLFLIDSNGQHLRKLTRPGNFQTDADATWSPDGKSIAFESDRDQDAFHSWSLYIVNVQNRHVRKVLPPAARDTNDLEPDWSPDGKKLVFIRTFPYPDYRIYSVNVDGSGQREILRNNSAPQGPVWSPNGHEILYGKDAGSHALALVDASGRDDRVVHTFSFLTSVGGYDWRPNY
jgi:Tol biopolymer transport system component